jgi:hypothetical protein
MLPKTRIAIKAPSSRNPEKHFTLQIKHQLYNEPSVFNNPAKILVISDIEGNFNALLHLLQINGVVDKYLKWTFDDGHLVIVGDCFDRGNQVVECVWLIYSLEEKARKKGGYVHFILGNHEIMNLSGDWRYVHPKYAQTPGIPYTALYNGNSELWQWLCTKNIIEKIGDLLFVHGGISNEFLQHDLTITEINNVARPHYTKAGNVFSDPLLTDIFNSENSPFWYRGYYKESANEKMIDDILLKYDSKIIITGHTIVDQVSAFFNGKVINVDTNHAGGMSEALLIKKGRFYRITNGGKKKRLI